MINGLVNGQITPTVISDDDDVMIRSFGKRILRFNRETKFTKNSAKLFKNSRSNRRGGHRTITPPPLNTPLARGYVGLLSTAILKK